MLINVFRYFHSEPHRHSPSMDQGYHTLMSSPTALSTRPMNNHHLTTTKLNCVRNISLSSNSTSLCSISKPSTYYTASGSKAPIFDCLPNEVIIKIFQWLETYELCNLATVCRRFEKLIWSPFLWKKVILNGEEINGDKALNSILRRLCEQNNNNVCNVERVMLSEGCYISDKVLLSLIRKCPGITHLQIPFSVAITNQSLFDFVSKCTNLQHLNITGEFLTY